MGLGTIAGFKLQVEDRTDQGNQVLNQVMAEIQTKARKTPELQGVFSNFNIGVPQLYAHLDRTKASNLGVEVQDVFDTMQTYLGSIYVNDFNRFGRTYEVIAQADTPFRTKARRYSAAAGPQRVRQDGAAGRGGRRHPDHRAGQRMRYNGFRSRRPQRRPGARLFDRARRKPPSPRSWPILCRRACNSSGRI